MSLPEALERAAEALPSYADAIRPANGDPVQLLATLDADACGEVLAWLLSQTPDTGEELLEAWCESDEGVARVQQVDPSGLPKAGRKLLRRAIHRLRTSGVEVAASAPSDKVVSRLSSVEDEIEGAYLTPVDPRGSVLLFLVEPNPSGGARLFQVLLDERRGVVEFDVYSTGRSRTRSFVRKLTESSSSGTSGAVEVDAGVARALLSRIALAHPKDRPFPRAFSEWRRKVEEGAGDAQPGDAVREMLGGASSPEALARVAERVAQGELGPWPGDPNRLTEVSTALNSAMDDVVALEGDARDEARGRALETATAALFDETHASQTAARFETSAYVSALGGREDEARDHLSAAASFGDAAPGDNPIARALAEQVFASTLERAETPAADAARVSADAPDT
ncbi:MAG: hypothetical protein QF570_10785 [Myxococcota bacterium]|nr:hypothetical protein [Myxococcota bacterium]